MALELTPLFVGGMPGTPEMMLIVLVLVLLFGANKIPKLARSTGQAMGEFQRGREEIDKELEEMRETADPTSSPSDSDRDSEPSGDGSVQTETGTADTESGVTDSGTEKESSSET